MRVDRQQCLHTRIHDAPPPPPTEQANRSPFFNSTAPTAAAVGQLFRYDAAAIDPDSDPLTFDLVVKPAGMRVQQSTGIVVWVPTLDQEGDHDVILRVQDGNGGVALQSFSVAVTRANTGPVITSVPTGPAIANFPYEYQVRTQDADGDPIAYRLDGPEGMQINETTGLVTWTPRIRQFAVTLLQRHT